MSHASATDTRNGSSSYLIDGGIGNDTIYGGVFDSPLQSDRYILNGDAGDDIFYANTIFSGKYIINGGLGNDTLNFLAKSGIDSYIVAGIENIHLDNGTQKDRVELNDTFFRDNPDALIYGTLVVDEVLVNIPSSLIDVNRNITIDHVLFDEITVSGDSVYIQSGVYDPTSDLTPNYTIFLGGSI